MRFSIFDSVRAARGRQCTWEDFYMVCNSQKVRDIFKEIRAAGGDHDAVNEAKKRLPVVTWQAFFDGARKNAEAHPSGLFMLDVDHVDKPRKLYADTLCAEGRKEHLGIMLVHRTPSGRGLRVVAKCRPEFSTIEECQRWLSLEMGLSEFDAVCKDFARCSYVVPEEYLLYLNGAIFSEEPAEGTVYAVEVASPKAGTLPLVFPEAGVDDTPKEPCNESEDEYKGIPLAKIAEEWLESTGGMPERGERNARLYKLALRMRYICDFDAATMMRVMPRCGLLEGEIRQLVGSSLSSTRAADMPKDLRDVVNRLEKANELVGDDDIAPIITDTHKVPSLPPLLSQWWDIAPDDFKVAVTLCQLPILGALGSKLRARYLDGRMHSPSFQVSLEAPQASGKSFMSRLCEYELAMMKQHDEEERLREEEYNARVREMKLLNVKITPENKADILGTKPTTLIRYVPATMSITKLLIRMQSAQGLHLFAMSEEIDTVYKAFKRGFSSYSDALRNAFDNAEYGQDYASENSFSGIVRLYYNVLFSGTPKAMCRFYPDVEDGLVSRVLFVTLPDQFGKAMPVWGTFDKTQKQVVDVQLVRLNEITLQGSEVQPDHELKLDWLNKRLAQWIQQQQAEAVRTEDRTRDVFCRRAAVVGFRAGMLAFFLWGEKSTPPIRRNVCNFAMWVANHMLNQHLLRFNIKQMHSNVNHWEKVFDALPNEFTRDELERQLAAEGYDTTVKQVLYKWKLLGNIEETAQRRTGSNNKKTAVKFKKKK